MSKIVCLDSNYKVHKVYENLDALLKEVKGSKTQAHAALEDTSKSFRTYKLIYEDKLPEVLASLYQGKLSEVRDEYKGTIENLEKEVKNLTKKDRKAKFKLDSVEDDYTQKITELNKKKDDELQALALKKDKEKSDLLDSHNNEVSKIKEAFDTNIEDLKKQSKLSQEELITKYTEHIDTLTAKYKEYEAKVESKENDYLKAVDNMEEKYKQAISTLLNNIQNLTNYLEVNRKHLINRVVELADILSEIVERDVETYALDESDTPLVDLEVVKILDVPPLHSIGVEKVSEVDKAVLGKNEKLELPTAELPTQPKDIDAGELPEYKEPVKEETVQAKPEKVEVAKEVESKEVKEPVSAEKEENKVVEIKREWAEPEQVEDTPTYVNGTQLKTKPDYQALSENAQALYLINLIKKGIRLCDIESLGDVKRGITESLASTLISELISEGIPYSKVADYLDHVDVQGILNKLGVHQKEMDKFLENTTVREEDVATEEDDSELPEGAIKFDWEKYINILNQNVDMEELLDKNTITIPDLQRVISVPSRQILGMISVLKGLGYEKDFHNERVVSKMETILLIVVSSTHGSQKGNESIRDIVEKLYPSWVKYRKEQDL